MFARLREYLNGYVVRNQIAFDNRTAKFVFRFACGRETHFNFLKPDVAKKLEKYDEAIGYYDKAGEIGTYFCDEIYCKANLYEDIGEYKKAYDEYIKLAGILRKRGYDVEADAAEADATEIRNKL